MHETLAFVRRNLIPSAKEFYGGGKTDIPEEV